MHIPEQLVIRNDRCFLLDFVSGCLSSIWLAMWYDVDIIFVDDTVIYVVCWSWQRKCIIDLHGRHLAGFGTFRQLQYSRLQPENHV